MDGVSIDNIKEDRNHALKQACEMSKHHPSRLAWVVEGFKAPLDVKEAELANIPFTSCMRYYIIEGASLTINSGETLIAIFQDGTRKMLKL